MAVTICWSVQQPKPVSGSGVRFLDVAPMRVTPPAKFALWHAPQAWVAAGKKDCVMLARLLPAATAAASGVPASTGVHAADSEGASAAPPSDASLEPSDDVPASVPDSKATSGGAS